MHQCHISCQQRRWWGYCDLTIGWMKKSEVCGSKTQWMLREFHCCLYIRGFHILCLRWLKLLAFRSYLVIGLIYKPIPACTSPERRCQWPTPMRKAHAAGRHWQWHKMADPSVKAIGSQRMAPASCNTRSTPQKTIASNSAQMTCAKLQNRHTTKQLPVKEAEWSMAEKLRPV